MNTLNDKTVWDAGEKEPFINGLRIKFVRRKILSRASRSTHKTIMDIGCGNSATFLRSVQGTFEHRFGVDFNIDTNKLKNYGITPLLGDALSVLQHTDDDSIDIITFLSIMEHVPPEQHVAILKECRRVLRKNGFIFINSPSWFGKFVLEDIIIRFFDTKKCMHRKLIPI